VSTLGDPAHGPAAASTTGCASDSLDVVRTAAEASALRRPPLLVLDPLEA